MYKLFAIQMFNCLLFKKCNTDHCEIQKYDFWSLILLILSQASICITLAGDQNILIPSVSWLIMPQILNNVIKNSIFILL